MAAMSKREVFIDSGGFYSLLVSNDSLHAEAIDFLTAVKRDNLTLVTTDYILDETVTLLKARKVPHLAPQFFNLVDTSAYLRLEWTHADRFMDARTFFQKYLDHGYSFTNCVSFVTMRELKISKALTGDRHFEEAGFDLVFDSVNGSRGR